MIAEIVNYWIYGTAAGRLLLCEEVEDNVHFRDQLCNGPKLSCRALAAAWVRLETCSLS